MWDLAWFTVAATSFHRWLSRIMFLTVILNYLVHRTAMKRIICAILISLLFAPAVQAQLCSGSLGSPIVNIDFGSGTGAGAPLSAAATSYVYAPGDCPNDGAYAVVNRTTNCFGSTWHTINSDHTGNPSGYFMLVNASFQPSAFYTDTIDVLCGNTTYEFAAWIANVIRPGSCSGSAILPNLTFRIETATGVLLQSYQTGGITAEGSPQWKQYGFYFTTPAAVSKIVLRIINNAQGGCGNDLALDDITFRPCGPLVSTSMGGSQMQTICEGITSVINFNGTVSPGYTDPVFQWQESNNAGTSWSDITGAVTLAYSRTFTAGMPAGTYRYRLAVAERGNTNTACRVYALPNTVTVTPPPDIAVLHNSPLCEGDTLYMEARGGNGFSWQGPDGFSNTGPVIRIPRARPSQSGQYTVRVANAAGCYRDTVITILVNSKPLAAVTPGEQTLCEGDSVQLQAAGGLTYSWFPKTGLSGDNGSTVYALPADSIVYGVKVANAAGCSDTAFASVHVISRPRAFAGPDQTIIQGQSVTLAATASGDDITWTWSPQAGGNPSLLQPIVSPVSDMTYILTVSSNYGCGIHADSMWIRVYKDLYIPNAFSPNGDGLNETWKPVGLDAFGGATVQVYNRWGVIVFSSTTSSAWDGRLKGTPQPPGIYIYSVAIPSAGLLRKGSLLLIR